MPTQFDRDLTGLKEKLLKMGAIAEQMIRNIIAVVVDRETELLDKVYQSETQMDVLQNELDEETILLIAIHTPVAGDLRFLLMVTRINAEIERIGDKVEDIGHIVEKLLKKEPLSPLVDFRRIAEVAESMTRRSLDAFTHRSYEEAMDTINSDDEADRLNDEIFRVLFTRMLDDPHNIGSVLGQMLISHAFEKISDHAVNIAEDVVYMVRGKNIRHLHDVEDNGT